MESIAFCIAAFVAVYWFTRRSLVAGLEAVLAVGYFYGIVRANVPETFSHFIFDAGLAGLYLGTFLRGLTPIEKFRIQKLRPWVIALIAWPTLLLSVPVQDTLIQLVGWRGAVWFVPCLFFGALIEDEERSHLALWLAVLNLSALVFALAEFSLGLERFYPHNANTLLIYTQNDVVKGAWDIYRIPATFVQQAAYSSTMVLSIPLLIGACFQAELSRAQKFLLGAGIIAASMGVFLGASRSQVLLFFAQIVALASLAKIRLNHWLAFAAVALVIGYWVYRHPRLQRFTHLNSGYVAERVHGSVNENFIDALVDYPLGNGLGGGGTSIPSFLQDRLKNPVVIENEYGRILLETGIPGLFLWLAFILTTIATAPNVRSGPWRLGWRLSRVTVALYFGTAFIGTGLLTAIPGTCMLLFMTGWLNAPKLKQLKIAADQAHPWADRVTAEWSTGY
jgi:hypothetical protein